MGWNKLSVRSRILVGYGLILLLSGLLTAFLVVQVAGLNTQINQLNARVASENRAGRNLTVQVGRTQRAIDLFLQQPLPANFDSANIQFQVAIELAQRTDAELSDPVQRQRLASITTQLRA